MEIRIDRACRGCLKEEGEMRGLFTKDAGLKPSLLDMLLNSTRIQMCENDGLPCQICAECIAKLHNAFTFKYMCEISDARLKKFIKSTSPTSNVFVPKQESATQSSEIIDFSSMFNSDLVSIKTESETHNVDLDAKNGIEKSTQTVSLDEEDVKKFSCTQCDKSFRTALSFKAHMKKHSKYACETCGKLFDNETSVKKHASKAHVNEAKKLECPVCGAGCEEVEGLVEHMKEHRKKDSHTCENCERRFAKSSSYERHLKFCSEGKQHPCFACGKKFSSPKALILHNELIHGKKESDDDDDDDFKADFTAVDIPEKRSRVNGDAPEDGGTGYEFEQIMEPVVNIKEELLDEPMDASDKSNDSFGFGADFEEPLAQRYPKKSKKRSSQDEKAIHHCSLCKKSFIRLHHLKRHEMTHKTGKKYECDLCDKTFARGDHLRRHKWQHVEVKPYACNQCNKGFTRPEQLDRHKIAKHSAEEKAPKTVFCTLCPKGFTSEKYLDSHMRVHAVDKGIVCKRCSKTFETKFELKEHKKTHAADKPFLCTECGQCFIKNEYLVVHMRRHRGEKPFKCRFCDKGFFRTTDLVAHERYHTEEKTHLCTICGKGFQRQYNLTVHLRVHTGEKPYACSYCEKRFAQGNDLKSHIRRHTGERFKCEVCGEGFIQGYHLTQHKRSVHGIECATPVRRVEKHPNAQPVSTGPKSTRSKNFAKKQLAHMAALAEQLRVSGAMPYPFLKPVVEARALEILKAESAAAAAEIPTEIKTPVE